MQETASTISQQVKDDFANLHESSLREQQRDMSLNKLFDNWEKNVKC